MKFDYEKDKKYLFTLVGVVLVVAVVAICLLFIKQNSGTLEGTENIECQDILGGGFILEFNTNGGNNLEDMNVCIACGPSSYKELPIPVKENATFDGWYYDKELTNKVNGTSSLDITPVADLDKNGCKIGYKNVTLYAKWK